MKLATLRTQSGTVAVRIEANQAVEIAGASDVSELLTDPAWHQRASQANGPTLAVPAVGDPAWAPVLPAPKKILCVGLNYANHIREMGRELPEFPTLFAKYPEALVGAYDPIELPAGADQAVDWEAELTVVIGTTVRRADEQQAAAAIAGYTVANDVTMRDYQYRSPQWLQGKTFEATCPLGPVLVTADEYTLGGQLSCAVDGEQVQVSSTDDLVHGPAFLVSYISQILTLQPGDLILTGTPGGVGHARNPKRYLQAGQTLQTTIEGIGELRNLISVGGA